MKITASTVTNIVLSLVLLSSLFYVGVTSSIAVYDPYADYDQDGDIDIYDVVPMADAYGTTGDSTRNVTVTNFPSVPEPKIVVVCQNHTVTVSGGDTVHIADVNVTEYQFASIFVAYYRIQVDDPIILCEQNCLGITSASDGEGGAYGRGLQLSTHGSWETRSSIGLEVGAPYLSISVLIPNGSVELTIVAYCYN